MLQRPQTLVFIAAAILCFITAYVPLVGYSSDYSELPDDVQKRVTESNPQIVVKASGLDYQMNKPSEPKLSDEEFEKGMKKVNEQLDEEVEKRDLGIIFMFGTAGCILLGLSIIGLIFLFKRRRLQIRFGVVLVLLTLLVTTGVFIASKVALDAMVELELLPTRMSDVELVTTYKLGFFLLPAIAVLLLVGVILVRKDDNLVKSLDRLR
ncbi:MAG: DUF4293 domain-containing protein [bacterium]|nr:DUF4293 domain-containing protein [bacterium]